MSDCQTVDLLVRGGTVVPCDGSRRAFVGDVAVRDGCIAAVTPASGGEAAPTAARVIDASGCAVIPGFVNAHTHELMERDVFEDMDFFTWLEDFALPKDMAYEPRHQRAGSLMCQAEMIANGTTSFIDIFRFPAESAAVAVDSGLRATISPQAVDTPAGAGETLESSEAFIDAWHGRHPRVRAWFGPHSLYTVDPATYTAMRQRTDELGVGIHTHLAETQGEVARVAELSGGLTPVEWLDRLIGLGPDVVAAHCIELTDDDLDLLASTGVGVAHCPTSNMKLGNRAARIPELLAAGATVGLGTDSIMTNNNLDPFEEMHAGVRPSRRSRPGPRLSPRQWPRPPCGISGWFCAHTTGCAPEIFAGSRLQDLGLVLCTYHRLRSRDFRRVAAPRSRVGFVHIPPSALPRFSPGRGSKISGWSCAHTTVCAPEIFAGSRPWRGRPRLDVAVRLR